MVEPLGVRAFLASFRLSDCTMEIELQFVAPVCVHIGIVYLYTVTHIECAGSDCHRSMGIDSTLQFPAHGGCPMLVEVCIVFHQRRLPRWFVGMVRECLTLRARGKMRKHKPNKTAPARHKAMYHGHRTCATYGSICLLCNSLVTFV